MRNAIVLASCCLLSASVLAESAAGVRWTAPDGWANEGSRPMRAATYRIAPASGDKASAECGVYFFGAGQGGTVEANLERWKSQFKDPTGKVAPAQIAKRTSHGLTITTIDTAQGSNENIASLTSVIDRNSADPEAYNVRGSAYGRAGKYREAGTSPCGRCYIQNSGSSISPPG